jgi:tripartite-type tricarboxylate transporter receptor subunit TctC
VLAVTAAARFELLPDIPTVGDFIPGYEVSQWYAVGLRKNTPTEIVDKLAPSGFKFSVHTAFSLRSIERRNA